MEPTSSPYDDVGLLSFGSPSQRSQVYPFSPGHLLDKQEAPHRTEEVHMSPSFATCLVLVQKL